MDRTVTAVGDIPIRTVGYTPPGPLKSLSFPLPVPVSQAQLCVLTPQERFGSKG